jgi:hypothetical protein
MPVDGQRRIGLVGLENTIDGGPGSRQRRVGERPVAEDRREAGGRQQRVALATYVDPLMRGTGRTEIESVIAAVQGRFPAFRFALVGPADTFGGHVRFSWTLGPPDGTPVVKGTDFVTRDGDAIASVIGFLDHVPAAA